MGIVLEVLPNSIQEGNKPNQFSQGTFCKQILNALSRKDTTQVVDWSFE